MIILIGFPKSGTTSFNDLFKASGYKSYHYAYKGKSIGLIIRDNIEHGKKMLHGFDDDCAITQMDICETPKRTFFPQITHYERLYSEYPNAVYILNKRDKYSLLSSFKRWNKYNTRLLKHCSHWFEPVSDYDDDDKILWLIDTHYNNVETFFTIVGAKFIVYDIEKDGVNLLTPYIKLRGTKFPHSNKNTRNPHIN